jgi:hypothetical protein
LACAEVSRLAGLSVQKTTYILKQPEPRFGDNADGVGKVGGSVKFNLMLPRPRHVVRPEEPLDTDREFHTQARIHRQELLPDGDI